MAKTPTILIIDDEEGMRVVVRTVLESEGFNVAEASNGEEGLAAVLELRPDLVLCDIEMPRKDGYEVLRMFLESGAAPIPFIFLSGRSARTDMRKGMNLGADDFLTKPFTGDELRAAVSTRLKLREHLDADAERKMDELRESITTSVPHELRTPLTGILGFAHVLEEQAKELSPEEISELANHIVDSGNRLQMTLEKFWTFTELAIKARDPKVQETLRNEELPGVHAFIRVLAKTKAQDHHRESDLTLNLSERMTARVSSLHLTRILEETLENAFKFSEAGTPVTVTAGFKEGYCVLRVEDHGRGMEEDQIQAIGGFMQFERRRHEQQGLGLGLSIAREIARLYGGDVTIESTPAKGTAVIVRFQGAEA